MGGERYWGLWCLDSICFFVMGADHGSMQLGAYLEVRDQYTHIHATIPTFNIQHTTLQNSCRNASVLSVCVVRIKYKTTYIPIGMRAAAFALVLGFSFFSRNGKTVGSQKSGGKDCPRYALPHGAKNASTSIPKGL